MDTIGIFFSLENEAFLYSIEHVDRKKEIEAERRRVALYTIPGHNLNPIYSSSLRDRNIEEHVFKNIIFLDMKYISRCVKNLKTYHL